MNEGVSVTGPKGKRTFGKEVKESEPKRTSRKEVKESEPKRTSRKEVKGSEPKRTSRKEVKGSEPKRTSRKEVKESEPKRTSRKEVKESEPKKEKKIRRRDGIPVSVSSEQMGGGRGAEGEREENESRTVGVSESLRETAPVLRSALSASASGLPERVKGSGGGKNVGVVRNESHRQLHERGKNLSSRTGICEHGRRRRQCKECGGSSICEHGRQRHKCKECGGSSICEHGQARYYCKQCGGKGLCEHGRRRNTCKECGGSSVCEHGRDRYYCKECGGRGFCKHGRRRSKCSKCEPKREGNTKNAKKRGGGRAKNPFSVRTVALRASGVVEELLSDREKKTKKGQSSFPLWPTEDELIKSAEKLLMAGIGIGRSNKEEALMQTSRKLRDTVEQNEEKEGEDVEGGGEGECLGGPAFRDFLLG
uniref:CR-type domain-containing protein n=1 Tax=Chromera velia CCMP2878 TaxID=1169474 RepID=A0A0G4H8J3_9ALVE|eukprot:Cvel_25190.t1-p1 / transcript=Cvel_25190.t1 / gene=Cvel_25190 / organism=Chromera_velia_CCMP2878 / gene_product=Zinc finger protein 345, putative / transcript_product=Zinc finger protein 345, putative / location=Cvel_scaffold2819:21040-23120(+) / protein_length=421 / sequence_SO=supercontig / SO=protein_coding / is_pseudo=false